MELHSATSDCPGTIHASGSAQKNLKAERPAKSHSGESRSRDSAKKVRTEISSHTSKPPTSTAAVSLVSISEKDGQWISRREARTLLGLSADRIPDRLLDEFLDQILLLAQASVDLTYNTGLSSKRMRTQQRRDSSGQRKSKITRAGK